MTYNDYKRNRQALDDLAQGKQTDAVKEFLKHYEIRPRKQEEQQNTNEKRKRKVWQRNSNLNRNNSSNNSPNSLHRWSRRRRAWKDNPPGNSSHPSTATTRT